MNYSFRAKNIYFPSLFLLSILISFAACKKEASLIKQTPTITFSSISVDSMQAGSDEAILVNFAFTDGDGDLGVNPGSGGYDIYTKDSRDTGKINYFFPYGLSSFKDPKNGISGKCEIAVQAAFYTLRPSRPLRDTFHLEIYIRDRAGNESNRIYTPDIYLTK